VASYFPEKRRTEAALPQGFVEASGDFQGLALNRADGKRYAAVMIRENGGFQEHYGASPLREHARYRIDQQAGADFSLRLRLVKWGTFTLDGMAKRNWSTVAAIAPIWIPKWDLGAALKWNRGWSGDERFRKIGKIERAAFPRGIDLRLVPLRLRRKGH